MNLHGADLVSEILARARSGERPAAIARALDCEPKRVSAIISYHAPNLKSPGKKNKPNLHEGRGRVR